MKQITASEVSKLQKELVNSVGKVFRELDPNLINCRKF